MKTSPVVLSSRPLASSRPEARPLPGSRLARALLACAVGIVLAAAAGCEGEGASSSADGGGGATQSSSSSGAGGLSDVRGDRYCEILIGKLAGTTVHVEIYNTYPLNDCPEAAWSAVDPVAVKAAQMADAVILNGPRYWTMDAFKNSSVVDDTPRSIGGIEMRVAGTIDLPLADVQGGEAPYATRTVNRTTTWVYQAGKPVYELVDPQGRVFDMQSYSVQQTAQTIDSLANLGGKLTLPAGWKFRTRTLDADLAVTAVNGVATIVQDDFANTYQLSQVAP